MALILVPSVAAHAFDLVLHRPPIPAPLRWCRSAQYLPVPGWRYAPALRAIPTGPPAWPLCLRFEIQPDALRLDDYRRVTWLKSFDCFSNSRRAPKSLNSRRPLWCFCPLFNSMMLIVVRPDAFIQPISLLAGECVFVFGRHVITQMKMFLMVV